MKKILFFVLLLVSFGAFSQEKNAFKIFYKYHYLKDSTEVHSQKSDTMVLETKPGRSVFYSHLRKVGDSVFNKDKENGMDQMTLLMNRYKYHLDKNAYRITKDFVKDTLIFYDEILAEAYQYTEKIPTINWSIEDEKDDLLGYSVGKAKGRFAGRDYVAWFSEEIPVPDGPYKFNGLPGLILKVEDTKKQFLFEAVALQGLNSFQVWEKVKPVNTSKKKYTELKERASKDWVQYINTSTEVKITLNSPHKRPQKPYNPIELE
ncbi:GLPGLI family protein [Bergeyella sp. RCAD1439]|uniref:GLPGLI family protein n=1 Tax=Bergeyella anatis TaxID=3113737 RepID=UPI002E19832D|nr:GLPGLI family protein [Bergeyella sp. RCAD1439]